MSPSENSILTNFLLPPAPLPTIISLRQFTELFPRAYQSNPHVKVLYQELQHQRVIDIDDVKRGIATEVKKGEKQRRQISRTRRKLNQEYVAGIGGQESLIEAEVRISLQQAIFQRLLFLSLTRIIAIW
jgi:centromere-localized protein 2